MIALIVVIAGLIVAGVIGLVVLAGLASGATGPKRFAVSEPVSVVEFFADAPWAATVDVDVAESVAQVWNQATGGPLLALGSVIRGPEVRGNDRQYRGLVAATCRVLEATPDSGIVAVGTGVSIPLVVKSFAERVVVSSRGSGTRIEYTLAVQLRFIGFLPLQWTAVFVRPFIAAAIKRAF